jgi:hypothetical protein
MSGYKYLVDPRVDIHEPDASGADMPAGFSTKLNPTSITFEPQAPDVQERISHMTDNEGAVLDADYTPKPQKLSLTVDDLKDGNDSIRLFAAAFSGREVSVAQAAATKAPFSVAVKGIGRGYFMGRRNLKSTGTVVHKRVAALVGGVTEGQATSGNGTTLTMTGAGWTVDDLITKAKCFIYAGTGAGQIVAITDNTADTITATFSPALDATSKFRLVAPTALTAGTDYTVDTAEGELRALAGGAVAVDDVLDGYSDCYAIAGTGIQGAVKAVLHASIAGKAKNKISGQRGALFIPNLVATATDNVELIGEPFLATKLSGSPQVPTRALLEALGWESMVDADGNNLWGTDPLNPTVPYLFVIGETYATA